jgi:hypothetical protein
VTMPGFHNCDGALGYVRGLKVLVKAKTHLRSLLFLTRNDYA